MITVAADAGAAKSSVSAAAVPNRARDIVDVRVMVPSRSPDC